jgi:23S rRNA (cytosine1962-C5)-methyltransferase
VTPPPPDPRADADGYDLLDSGGFEKLERFGAVTLARPCAQAFWRRRLPPPRWTSATARFTRDGDKGTWTRRAALPDEWTIELDRLRFHLRPTDFGHLGIFPEQRDHWRTIRERCQAHARNHRRPAHVLNLFAYSGGSTLAAAAAGAEVCHVDASKGMVEWARDNARLNGLASAPVRWIVDDVIRFLEREARRDRRYDLVVLDPPSYGRGSRGEVFKIETSLPPLLAAIRSVLTPAPLGVLLSCHTPELTPIALDHLLRQDFGPLGGRVDHGEMLLRGRESGTLSVPSGSFAFWSGP